jgi:hypothetical protein
MILQPECTNLQNSHLVMSNRSREHFPRGRDNKESAQMNVGSTFRRAIVTVIAGAFGIAAMYVSADAGQEVGHYFPPSSVSQSTSGGAEPATSAGTVRCLSGPRYGCAAADETTGGEEKPVSDDSPSSPQSVNARGGQQDGNAKWAVTASGLHTTGHFTTWEM